MITDTSLTRVASIPEITKNESFTGQLLTTVIPGSSVEFVQLQGELFPHGNVTVSLPFPDFATNSKTPVTKALKYFNTDLL